MQNSSEVEQCNYLLLSPAFRAQMQRGTKENLYLFLVAGGTSSQRPGGSSLYSWLRGLVSSIRMDCFLKHLNVKVLIQRAEFHPSYFRSVWATSLPELDKPEFTTLTCKPAFWNGSQERLWMLSSDVYSSYLWTTGGKCSKSKLVDWGRT